MTSLSFERETEFRESVERGGEMIDGVVGNRQRAVAAFVVNLEAEIDDVLFADLDVVGDFLAVERFAPAAFVERVFGVDPIAMIFDEPVDAAVGAAAFFVGGEGDDDVAIGLEAFLFVLNQVGDPDGGLGFVVAGAAAVEVAVFFGEHEGIDGPVFALGFDDVGVGEEEERLLLAGAVVADDEVAFFVDRAADERCRSRGSRRL